MEEAIKRIEKMERHFEELAAALREGTLDAAAEAMESLSAYLSGGDWLRDYELDEQGLLPKGMKRGVLAQDSLYELLCSAAAMRRAPESAIHPLRRRRVSRMKITTPTIVPKR